MNYNKQGYSVAEVAQLIHCTPVTVRSYILNGKMPARINKPGPAGRNSYRITRENLYTFLVANSNKYDKELIDQFSPTTIDTHAESTDQTQSPTPKAAIIDNNGHEAYSATSVSDLQGAWKTNDKPQDVLQPSRESSRTPYHSYRQQPAQEARAPYRKYPSYEVALDGRICVCNVESKTAAAIAAALLEDRQCKFKQLTINKSEAK